MDHEFPDKRFVVLKVKSGRVPLAQDSCFPGKETKLSYSNSLVEGELGLEPRLLDYYSTIASIILSHMLPLLFWD